MPSDCFYLIWELALIYRWKVKTDMCCKNVHFFVTNGPNQTQFSLDYREEKNMIIMQNIRINVVGSIADPQL